MSTLIPSGHVYVKPLDFDVEYNIFQLLEQNPHSVGNVKKSDLKCSIFKSVDTMYGFYPDKVREYKAKISGARMWLNPKAQKRQLVITLESDDLVRRNEEIESMGYRSLYPEYIPHMTVQYDVPPAGDAYKWWVNSIITLFNPGVEGTYHGLNITFVEETLGDLEIVRPLARNPVILTI